MTKLTLLALLATTPLAAQLDPTRNLPIPAVSTAAPLPEQYLWTASDLTLRRPDHNKFPWNRPDLRIAPHYFRAHFTLTSIPAAATVYIAGPREAHVYLNGHLLGDFYTSIDAPINFRVFHATAAQYLQKGDNILAIEAIRGKGVVSGGGPLLTSELAYGEVLAAKILPAAFGHEAPPLLISDTAWRSTATLTPNWQTLTFDDKSWPQAESLGSIDNVDFYQWSADAGMYGWPGYRGMSPSLRNYSLPAAAVTHIFRPELFHHLANLAPNSSVPHSSPSSGDEWEVSSQPFTVSLPQNQTDAEAPSLLLDFGKEVAGRLLVESASPQDSLLSIAYGESELEALATGLTSQQQGGNYLGTNLVEVPANGIARGPKSGFRYVRIRFLRGAPTLAFKQIRLEGIYYPVTYASFESSDPLLNKIWEAGAYTAHLCMQDGIWDAIKRDRGRWAGDLDVEARTILDAFGDSFLLEDTLRRIAESTPANAHVNGIPSYTALWITTLATLYQHTGDKAFLASQLPHIRQFLARMDADLGPDNLLTSPLKSWSFVDWAPGLFATTEATRVGSNFQYLRGYQAAVSLLNALNEKTTADRYQDRLKDLTKAASAYPLGSSWQLNTLVVLTGNSSAPTWEALASVKQDTPTDQVISPYFSAYLLDAMSDLSHPDAALAWIRTYWGGMLAEGATSLWESYDLRWPKTNSHLSLQADGTSGYFVSLAHGWSSGPTAWLTENVLGVTPETPGYDKVVIRPQLLGLKFARGSVPTPHGVITVEISPHRLVFDLPQGVEAEVFPDLTELSGGSTSRVFLDGKNDICTTCSPWFTHVRTPGRHVIEER